MYIMAIGTGHLSFAHRMMRGLEEFGLFFGMAIKADFRLFALVQYRVFTGMDFMAGGAGNVIEFVRAAFPGDTLMRCMTGHTLCVLILGRRPGFFAKINDVASTFFSFLGLGVIVARSMTAFALRIVMREGRARISFDTVFAFEDVENRKLLFFVMAIKAGFNAILAHFAL